MEDKHGGGDRGMEINIEKIVVFIIERVTIKVKVKIEIEIKIKIKREEEKI